MKKIIRIEKVPEEEVVDGKIVYNTGADMASADPSVYGRLMRAGKRKEAEKMLNEKGYWVLLEDGTYM